MDLSISDLSDEDYVLNNRNQPLPALMYGSFSFLSRIGQSLGPIVGFRILSLNWSTNDDTIHVNSLGAAGAKAESGGSSGSEMRRIAFLLLVWTPLISSVCQLAAWRKVSLKGAYLQNIKKAALSRV